MRITETLSQRFGQPILVGEETIDELGPAAMAVSTDAEPRVLLLSTTPPAGQATITMLGLETPAIQSLQKQAIKEIRPHYELSLEGPVPDINRLCRVIEEEEIAVIVNVAGSSGEDAAELAKLVVNQGVRPFDAWNYARGRGDGRPSLPIDDAKPERVTSVSYNTTVLTGSPTSPFTVMFQPKTLEKVSAMHLQKLRPNATLLSTGTLLRLPKWYLTLGGLDTLAHLVSAYLSRHGESEDDYSLAGRGLRIRDYALEGLVLLRDHLPALLRAPDHAAMGRVVEAALAGGRAIAVGTGPEHLGAHGYGRIGCDGSDQKTLPHCAAVAALLVPVLTYVFRRCAAAKHVEGLTRFARIAQVLDGQPLWDYDGHSAALEGDAARGLALLTNLVWDVYEASALEPVTLRSMGVRKDQIDLGVALWNQMANCHQNSPPYDHTRDSLHQVFCDAWDCELERQPT